MVPEMIFFENLKNKERSGKFRLLPKKITSKFQKTLFISVSIISK